jgi:hypothetical protein
MTGGRYSWHKDWRDESAWAKDFSIEAKPTKPQLSSDDKLAKKVMQCSKSIVAGQRKAKTAKTYLAKYQRRLRYLEKRAAASNVKIAKATDAPGSTNAALVDTKVGQK